MCSSSFLVARKTLDSSISRHGRTLTSLWLHHPITTKPHPQTSSSNHFHDLIKVSYTTASPSIYPYRFKPSSLLSTRSSLSSSSSFSSQLSKKDEEYMEMALTFARKGLGRTFPNPAVGCVLVGSNTDSADMDANDDYDNENDAQIIGAGFHPQAGYPHAEVFALLQAYGYVESGVKAAESVVAMSISSKSQKPEIMALFQTVQQLAVQYSSPDGQSQLFGPLLFSSQSPPPSWLQQDNPNNNMMVTAYVTLEPCCHYGKTPPCAMALTTTQRIQRVVVGLRDPNPKVQGGGIQLLQDAGIVVDVVPTSHPLHTQCHEMVASFVQRITRPALPALDILKGAQRATLRSKAHAKKTDGSLVQVTWPGPRIAAVSYVEQQQQQEETEPSIPSVENDDTPSAATTTTTTTSATNQAWQHAVDTVTLDTRWLESLDQHLWRQELVLLRLTTAVEKRKWAERLGQRIAQAVQAQVIQSVGHTVLLYRPNGQDSTETTSTTANDV